MRLCPTYIVIQDDYTKKTTIVNTSDKENLINELVNRATDLKVSFHVIGGYLAGEAETTITKIYDNIV